MITSEQFNDLWDYLLSNPWDFLDKERLPSTKVLFYNNLNDYTYDEVWKSFDHFIHLKGSRKMPMVQSVIANLEAVKESNNYKASQPFHTKDRRLHRLYRRMVKQARYIIDNYETKGQLLVNCGIKYENLRRQIMNKKLVISSIYYQGHTYKHRKVD